jgi:hypothetical protein
VVVARAAVAVDEEGRAALVIYFADLLSTLSKTGEKKIKKFSKQFSKTTKIKTFTKNLHLYRPYSCCCKGSIKKCRRFNDKGDL